MAIFTDDFTGTLDDLVSGRTGWTSVGPASDEAKIDGSNQCKILSAARGSNVYNVRTTNDYYAQAKSLVTASSNFMVVRLSDSSNYFGIRPNTTTWQLFENVSASLTLRESVTQTPNTNDIMYIQCDSADLMRMHVNATPIGSGYTSTTNNTVKHAGIHCRATQDPYIDDFEADDIGGGGGGGSAPIPSFFHQLIRRKMTL